MFVNIIFVVLNFRIFQIVVFSGIIKRKQESGQEFWQRFFLQSDQNNFWKRKSSSGWTVGSVSIYFNLHVNNFNLFHCYCFSDSELYKVLFKSQNQSKCIQFKNQTFLAVENRAGEPLTVDQKLTYFSDDLFEKFELLIESHPHYGIPFQPYSFFPIMAMEMENMFEVSHSIKQHYCNIICKFYYIFLLSFLKLFFRSLPSTSALDSFRGTVTFGKQKLRCQTSLKEWPFRNSTRGTLKVTSFNLLELISLNLQTSFVAGSMTTVGTLFQKLKWQTNVKNIALTMFLWLTARIW